MKYNSIIDLKSLVCLKYFVGKIDDFLKLDNELLLGVELLSYVKNESKDIEIKAIEKVICLQKLKKLDFSLYKTSDNDISKINGENTALTNLNIIWKNNKENCNLINLQKKFPNLSHINIITQEEDEDDEDSSYSFGHEKPIIYINENKKCKINNIYLYI